MKIAYQVAANFGGTGLGYISYQAVRAIHDAGMLAGITCVSHEKTNIRTDAITDVPSVEILSRIVPRRIANKLGLDALLRQSYFGFVAARKLGECDIVHGYTGQMLGTIRAAERRSACSRRRVRCVVDRPNTHVNFMRRALEAEYAKYDVPFIACRASQSRREIEELDRCDAVVTCSEFARQTMLDEGVDPGKVHVVHYGVDRGLFYSSPRQDDVFRVVFVGLICLRKGVQYLLEAWEQLCLDDPAGFGRAVERGEAELILRGHLLDDAVKVLKHFRNRCRFTIRSHAENMHDVRSLYNSASICVFPSVEDGFGMVVTEAMACNRPVLVTEHMGAAAVVVDGDDGYVVPPANAEKIKERISYLYRHRDSSLGADCRKRVSGLTWDAYRAGLLSVYKEIGATSNE